MLYAGLLMRWDLQVACVVCWFVDEMGLTQVACVVCSFVLTL